MKWEGRGGRLGAFAGRGVCAGAATGGEAVCVRGGKRVGSGGVMEWGS